jgi:hypothetical protein
VTQPAQEPPTTTPTPTPPVESRPGNGYSDSNHEHTGPPGQTKDKHHDKG